MTNINKKKYFKSGGFVGMAGCQGQLVDITAADYLEIGRSPFKCYYQAKESVRGSGHDHRRITIAVPRTKVELL